MKKTLTVFALAFTVIGAPVLFRAGSVSAAEIWKGSIPVQAKEGSSWVELLGSLNQAQMPFGAMSASGRMLAFFNDASNKETAYRAVIDLMDRGYPFSVNGLFVSGDLEAQGDAAYVNSYNLAKYVINHDAGMDRWAKQYLAKMDGEGFSKYQLYLAIRSYQSGKMDDAIDRLKKVLAADSGEGSGALAIKTARTLARLYFEKKQYAKSLDIYKSFLLKMNPIQPSDWLEAAWNHYYLKQYPEALGMLYNLESKAAGRVVSLEKYTLRALIYRETCSVDNAQAMLASFDKEFGPAIRGLKEGESAKAYPILAQLDLGPGSSFQQYNKMLSALQKEAQTIDQKIAPARRELAHYLYDSEIKLVQSQLKEVADVSLERAAERIITASEQLKYLKYDVARQKFDPDRVFQKPLQSLTTTSSPKKLASVNDDYVEVFRVHWPQKGDFWRNERSNFKGVITSQCNE